MAIRILATFHFSHFAHAVYRIMILFNMKLITALTIQKRNSDRVNVFLDGDFAFGLPFITASRLKVGQSLSSREIEDLQQQDSLDKAKKTAIRLISYRPRSVTEVQRHLERKGFEAQIVNMVLDHLQAVDLLNDVAFTYYWVEQRETFRPRSQMLLRQELQQKGVSRDVFETILADLDEMAAARRAAEKKARLWASLPMEEFRLKIGRFLQRRGFHYGIIKQVSDEMWQTMKSDVGDDTIS